MTVLTPKLHFHLHPPKSTHSTVNTSSVFESTVFDQLASVLLPDSEINDILNLHESLPLDKVLTYLDTIVERMTAWLEAAQMAVFTLELTLKEDGDVSSPGEARSLLDFSFGRIEPFVSILDEISDIVLDKLEDDVSDNLIQHQEKKLSTKMAVAKIQSEWANLQCFMASVVRQLDNSHAKKELVMLMESVLLQIDDLLTVVFQVQEKRLLSSTDLASSASSVSIDTASYSENDQMLVDIDHRIEPLFTSVQRIYTTMVPTSPSMPPPPADPSGALSRMHVKIQQRWETLRTEVDMLKQELKEERWLNVFQQVADQVDVMMDGLLTAIDQCNDSIQQAQTWYQSSMSKRSDHGLSIADRNRFKVSEKNFKAKHKCYTPAIDKMLTMLGESIVSKMTGDNATCRRHKTMIQSWLSLKDTMDVLITKDLPETRRILSLDRQPSRSANTNGTMHKSRESSPLAIDKDDRHSSVSRRSSTSVSSSSNSSYHRSPSSVASSTGGGHSNSRLRPSTSESSLRNSLVKGTTQRRTKTPIRPSTEYNHDAPAGDSKRVPPNAAWLLEPPKNMPGRRTQSVDHGRPRTPVGRSKTPTDSLRRSKTPVVRPKSSMGYAQQDDPIRRSSTPSLIPRPKTPTARLPSMIPRPHSSMLDSPPEPSFLTVPGASTSQKKSPRKKQSMPALGTNQRRATHVPRTLAKDRPRDGDFEFLNKDPSAVDYMPSPNDPLDVEVARIINACPIRVQCQKGPLGGGRYYFGNDLNLGGRKLYTCKLMSYTDRRTTSKSLENKVLIRVGGGWQELEMFLLDHSNLMVATPKVMSRPYSSMSYRN